MADDPSRPVRGLTVRDVMTTRVVTTSPDDSVADAAAAMIRRKVGSALIMQSGFLAGILLVKLLPARRFLYDARS